MAIGLIRGPAARNGVRAVEEARVTSDDLKGLIAAVAIIAIAAPMAGFFNISRRASSALWNAPG